MLPKISIIIAVKNARQTIKRCLESIADQTYSYKEVLIKDGMSTDGTLDILKEFSYVIDYLNSSYDTGVYNAWNTLLGHATGDWICFIGADDYFASNTVLEVMVGPLQQAAALKLPLVYGKIWKTKKNGIEIEEIGMPWSRAKMLMKHGMALPHPGLFHHRSLFEEYGLFDENFKISGDYELLLRVINKYDAMYVPDIVTVVHGHGGLSSKKRIQALKEVALAKRKHNIFPYSPIWCLIFMRAWILSRF